MGLVRYRRFFENADFEREHPRVPAGLEDGGEFTDKTRKWINGTRKFTDEEENNICDRYKNGESTIKLAKEFDIADVSVGRILHKHKIKIRNASDARRKLSLNQNVFSTITPESAYWIGFLMADGCIKKGNNITLRLSVTDISHVLKFRKFLSSGGKVGEGKPVNFGHYKSKPTSTLSVYSAKLISDLSNFGIVPNKTHRTTVKQLEFDPHFWRGVIDGDGTVGLYDNHPILRLNGSFTLLTQFLIFAKGINPNIKTSVCKHGSIFATTLTDKPAIDLIKVLYSNIDDTALDRKMEKAQEILHPEYIKEKE